MRENKFPRVFMEELKKQGISQSEMAITLNLSPMTINFYAHGKSFPNINTLLKISEVLNLSLDYLITGGGQKEPPKVKYEPAQWIYRGDKQQCNKCLRTFPLSASFNYCPYCGCDMRQKVEKCG